MNIRPKERLTHDERAKRLDPRMDDFTKEEWKDLYDLAESMFFRECDVLKQAKRQVLPYGLAMWSLKCAMTFQLAKREFAIDEDHWCHVSPPAAPIEGELPSEQGGDAPKSC